MAKNDIKVREVAITLDKKRTLRYDLNAFAELEELGMGTSGEVMEVLQDGSMKAMRGLLWAGLIHEDPELTLQQVGFWVTMDNLEDVSQKVTEAITGSLPDADAEGKKAEGK